MRLTWDNIQANAVAFSKRWENARREKADEQPFIIELLGVFGVEDPVKVGERQKEVKIKGETTKWIDYFWKNKIAVEMKSKGEDLEKAYWQLKERYMDKIASEDVPNLWLICDFENFHLYRIPTKEIFRFKLRDLRKNIKRFADIAGYETERIRDDQAEVNVKAAEKMAKLHDSLRENGYEGHELEVYLVRLLFCLFADDTGIFPQDSLFKYFEKSKPDGSDFSERIGKLFEVLNMPEEVRAKRKLLSEELKQFRYINGGLFSDILSMAEFNAKMRQTLLDCMNFDWNKISPAIFGAMFQGVMDKAQRRELGAHYTSEENILKLINPLFMDDLWKEFDRVKTDPAALDRFHDKTAKLKFLDPACGCGNFLIITYRELRLLELEILKMKGTDQFTIDITHMLKVSVEQFYGIEYEDFPCQIAMVGMWLIDHQMNLRASEQFGQYYARLPLKQSATIVQGNALRIEWADIVPRWELSYILGNPPFVGNANQSAEQKADILSVYLDPNGKPFKTAGKIDYVAAWYYKAAQFMMKTNIRAAFVSTNSITQGEQGAAVWKPLFDMFGIKINFGYRTFKWSNEAKGKAAVHCVIVGFGTLQSPLSQKGVAPAGDGGFTLNALASSQTTKLPARELRKNMTKQENHLWYDFLCKMKPQVLKQRPIGNYIVDFYCHKAKLAIELDGGQHYESDAIEYDKIRTDYIRSLGIEVIRFDNREVDEDFQGVCEKIKAAMNPPPPAGGTPFCERGLGNKGTHFCEDRGQGSQRPGVIYDGEVEIRAKNINPYLLDAPNVFIESRSKPLCDVPEMQKGSIPVDNGNLIIEANEYDSFIKQEPAAIKYIRRLLGSVEFINAKERCCLWLVDAVSNELRKMPAVMRRVEAVREFRLKSTKEATRKFAELPTRFMEIRQPKTEYLAIPKVSSERRKYIPVGFLCPEIISTDLLFVLPNASLYHFGILTSSVHNAWMRAVCGRLKSDYRYSNKIVYNNFPWPYTTDEQKSVIEKLAQAVLDARGQFPTSSLADLYDPLTMPPELLKAHRDLDRAVMKLYGFTAQNTPSEAACVAKLMELYQKIQEEI